MTLPLSDISNNIVTIGEPSKTSSPIEESKENKKKIKEENKTTVDIDSDEEEVYLTRFERKMKEIAEKEFHDMDMSFKTLSCIQSIGKLSLVNETRQMDKGEIGVKYLHTMSISQDISRRLSDHFRERNNFISSKHHFMCYVGMAYPKHFGGYLDRIRTFYYENKENIRKSLRKEVFDKLTSYDERLEKCSKENFYTCIFTPDHEKIDRRGKQKYLHEFGYGATPANEVDILKIAYKLTPSKYGSSLLLEYDEEVMFYDEESDE